MSIVLNTRSTVLCGNIFVRDKNPLISNGALILVICPSVRIFLSGSLGLVIKIHIKLPQCVKAFKGTVEGNYFSPSGSCAE